MQGVLEANLATLFQRFGAAPTIQVAGRTDAGVHALGQVAHLDLTAEQLASLDAPPRGGRGAGSPHRGTKKPSGAAALARRLNGIAGLDTDVFVLATSIAQPGFDARFGAVWRRYEYRVADSLSPRNPLLRNHTVWFPAELQVDAMDAAAASLTGLHDWASYCKPREGATTIRTLQDFRWKRGDDGVLTAFVQADAFCHSMVRALVGATVAVGEGKLAVDDPVALRDAVERTAAFKVMPAKGLALTEVGYPPDAELAARVEQTRARRDATSE